MIEVQLMICLGLMMCVMLLGQGFIWFCEMAGVLPSSPNPTMKLPTKKDMPLLKSASFVEPVMVRTQQYNKELM